MPNQLKETVQTAQEEFKQAQTPAALEDAKAKYLGKTGTITLRMKSLATLEPQERKTVGQTISKAKQEIETALNARRAQMAEEKLQEQLKAQSLDVTLEGRKTGKGALHPVSMAWEKIQQIFSTMGFDVGDGPEIENDWYNFTALGNPPNHPARSMQDTFYIDMKDENGQPYCLRTHTSPMQIRYATAYAQKQTEELTSGQIEEVRVIVPGRTYRVDSDATHSPMFHQVEGLWLGENISFADLKVTYLNFCKAFFETDELTLRFRPSYFPFTEPSAEIDIQFKTGALAGKWLEVSGAGQVHPQVVKNMGLDPEKYIGFAFGSGIDRLAMLKYGITDLRQFFEGDIRFLSQFK